MFKVNNKDTRTTPCSSVSIVSVEQVNAGWDKMIQSFNHFQKASIKLVELDHLNTQSYFLNKLKTAWFKSFFLNSHLWIVNVSLLNPHLLWINVSNTRLLFRSSKIERTFIVKHQIKGLIGDIDPFCMDKTYFSEKNK